MTAPSAIRPVTMKTPPPAAMVTLLLIFVCGVAVGALTMSLIHHSGQKDFRERNRELVQKLNREIVQKWTRELNLTEAQQREVIGTLDDLSKYYYNVIADGKDRILAILDDDQKQKFERILREKRKF